MLNQPNLSNSRLYAKLRPCLIEGASLVDPEKIDEILNAPALFSLKRLALFVALYQFLPSKHRDQRSHDGTRSEISHSGRGSSVRGSAKSIEQQKKEAWMAKYGVKSRLNR